MGYRVVHKWLGSWISFARGWDISCPCVDISGISAALGVTLEAHGWEISSPGMGY
jgi:hypothetical protein